MQLRQRGHGKDIKEIETIEKKRADMEGSKKQMEWKGHGKQEMDRK